MFWASMDRAVESQTPARHPLLALLVTLWAFACTAAMRMRKAFREVVTPRAQAGWRFGHDTAAQTGLPNFVAIVFSIVGAVLAATVGMIVLARLTPVYFGNFTEFLTELSGTATGDPLADAIISIIIIVIAIVGPIAFLGIAVAVVAIKFRGSST